MADTLIQAEEAIRRALEAEHMVRGDWHTSESDTSHGVHDGVCNVVAVCSPANHMHPDADLALSPATMLAIRNYIATVAPLNIRALLSGLDRLRSALAIKAPEPKIPMLARVFKMAIMAEGVEVQDVSVDNDGETLFDWIGPERQMISLSLDDDGRVAWASSTRDAREHGTDFFEGTLSEDLRDIVRQALPWSNRPAQDADARDAARMAFERAMEQCWRMIDPFNPPPAGSYALGQDNGIIAALKTVRMNFERELAAMAQARKEGGNGNSN